MEFRILGPLEVVHDGKLLALSGAKQRAIAGLLALNAPRPVSPDRLIDELWGEQPPQSALHAIQVYISGIRTALRVGTGSDAMVRTSSSGYALDVAEEDIDARRFERLVGEAQNAAGRHPKHARRILEEALALWRGPLLADIENVTEAKLEAQRLDELRLVATESLLSIRLDSGEHAELVGTLKSLVTQHPLREQLCRQLMLALYRSGRQSEALAAYQNARVALDELGLLPSPELRDLEQAILRHDESLEPARSPAHPDRADAPAEHRRVRADVVHARPPRPTASDPPLIGRQAELSVMFEAYGEALDRRPPLILVCGEPGIGKTRLAQEFAYRAADDGAVVGWGRCFEAEATAAYRPVASALRSTVASVPEEWLAAKVGPAEADVEILVPELTPLADAVDPALRVHGDRRMLLFDSVVRLLSEIAAQTPLVLVFDDIHAADDSSLALLGHIVRYTPNERILPVFTYRDTELKLRDTRSQWLDAVRGDRPAREVELVGLEPDQAKALATSVAGEKLPRTDLEALALQTGGNPLFVREIASHDPVGSTALPETVISAVRRRLATLDEACHPVLQLLAMTPGGAAIEVLAHASNTEVEGIVDAVESGVQAGLLREREELGMAFIDFVHPIFRQTIEGMTGAARRTRLHLRLADAMEDFGASTEDGRLGELASHAFASGRAARPDRVVRLCKLAGEMATAHTAFESALVHYKRALEAMSWGKPEPAERGEIALRCAEAHHMLGDASARQEAAETAFADASRAHKAGLMARSALLHGGARSTYGVASERTMELLQQSLEALESQPDDSLRAQVMSRLAQEHYHVGNYPLSDELSGEAITLACGTGDDRVVAATMEGRIWSLHRPETLAQRSELCDEMVKRAAAADDRERLIVALIWRCCAGLEGGEIERIDVDLEWLDALTETVRIPSQMFRVMTMRTTRAVMAGDYERGMALALETYRIGESIEPDNARQTLAAQLLPMLREQDALASVVPEAQRMASTYSSAAGWRCALALVYLEADMPDRARAELNRLVQEGLDKIPRDLAWLLANCYLAEVAAWLGEPAQTQELYNRLLPYGDRNGAVFDIASVGSVSHHLALLAKAAGWTRKAAKHFEAAIEFNDRTGQMPAAARSRYEYSRLLLEVSGSAAAEAHLTQTLETARRLKLNRLVAGAERLVGEAQIDPAGVR